MPRIIIGQEIATGTVLEIIANRINAKRGVVPIISHAIANELILGAGQHQKMVNAYGSQVHYDPAALAGQYSTLRVGSLFFGQENLFLRNQKNRANLTNLVGGCKGMFVGKTS
ncbi:MAG: hypothetical protein AB1801_19825, partial [Chloroflexota bacterium]